MSGVALMAGLVVLYAALARRLDRWSITSAILFTAAGLVCGARALDVLPLALNAESTKLLAELTLAVLLFADAATIDAGVARQEAGLAARLLLVGLPLTIALGTLIGGLVLPALGWAAAALPASILAPTDAALGMAVFTNRAVPAPRAAGPEPWERPERRDRHADRTFFLALVASEEDAGVPPLGAGGPALLSLTVVRMLPVALAVRGVHLRPETTLFMRWFGPRGLASVVFTLLTVITDRRSPRSSLRRLHEPGGGGRTRDGGGPRAAGAPSGALPGAGWTEFARRAIVRRQLGPDAGVSRGKGRAGAGAFVRFAEPSGVARGTVADVCRLPWDEHGEPSLVARTERRRSGPVSGWHRPVRRRAEWRSRRA